jgi:hypothetical protein
MSAPARVAGAHVKAARLKVPARGQTMIPHPAPFAIPLENNPIIIFL